MALEMDYLITLKNGQRILMDAQDFNIWRSLNNRPNTFTSKERTALLSEWIGQDISDWEMIDR